jgi:hypothetical protein
MGGVHLREQKKFLSCTKQHDSMIHAKFPSALPVAVLVFLLLLAPACGEDRSAVTALQQETEAIHDEAMRDLADMNRVKRKLKAELALPDSPSSRRDSLLAVRALMETADADMMRWMSEYQPPAENEPVEKALAYLKIEKEKISANGKMIRAALEAGQKMQSK